MLEGVAGAVGGKEGISPNFFPLLRAFGLLSTWKNVPLFGHLGSLGQERGDLCQFKREVGA